MSKLKVAVLCGGRSGEHEISLRSSEAILAGLDPARYEVQRIFIDKDGHWHPRAISPDPAANAGIDVVFPILHGTFGEDGTVQGLLELAGLPYVGAGVLASAASMDKDVMKRLLIERGLPVAEYFTVTRGRIDWDNVCGRLPFPVFVKPANLGSSVGITKAKNCVELKTAIEYASQYDHKVLVERGIIGREFECSVAGNEDPQAATPCEVIPSREFYDYEDKYLLVKARTILPAPLAPEQTARMQELAVGCYRAVECEGMGRVDFLLEASTGQFYINEINTIPGFTSISMFPKMWEAAGVGFSALLDQLIALALARHERRAQTRFTR